MLNGEQPLLHFCNESSFLEPPPLLPLTSMPLWSFVPGFCPLLPLFSWPQCPISMHQAVQSFKKKSDCFVPLLKTLQWLPRVKAKVLTITIRPQMIWFLIPPHYSSNIFHNSPCCWLHLATLFSPLFECCNPVSHAAPFVFCYFQLSAQTCPC